MLKRYKLRERNITREERTYLAAHIYTMYQSGDSIQIFDDSIFSGIIRRDSLVEGLYLRDTFNVRGTVASGETINETISFLEKIRPVLIGEFGRWN